MSIYVTLPSNGGGKESETTNTNASFKVRLPKRLGLKHEAWEVALVSISFPTMETVKRRILHKFPPTTKVGFQSGLLAYEEKDALPDPTKVRAVQGVVTMAQVMNGDIKDGYSFVRNLVVHLHTQLNVACQTKITNLKSTGTTMFNARWRHWGGPMDGQPYEQTLALGVDSLCITGNYPNSYIYTALHDDLAVAMGLIQSKTDATPGPATSVTFRTDDYQKPTSWSTFFKYKSSTETFVQLKSNVNWQIHGLNGGWFEKALVNPNRTLHVYSNANASSMVGNQVSDVLHEVNCESTKEGQQYFEPKHRQYLPVCQQEYKVMEVALDNLNGVPVQLGPGVTSVVLHFQHQV